MRPETTPFRLAVSMDPTIYPNNRDRNGTYGDESEITGHYRRGTADIDLMYKLGVTHTFYPVLWEHTSKQGYDFVDKQLKKLQEYGIKTTLTLLHHGNGPEHTNLLDPNFPYKFAEYAKEVALRYTDIDSFSLINEIGTTSLFSGLHGTWYPHGADEKSYITILFNQCFAQKLAMEEIRKVKKLQGGSKPEFIMKENIGREWATPPLQHQADFDNDRFFWPTDILTGKLDEKHKLWQYAREFNVMTEGELISWQKRFIDKKGSPDMILVDFYITSQRMLDHRYQFYPNVEVGGNAHGEKYVDVNATRVLKEDTTDVLPILRQTHSRYGIPIGLGEVHLGDKPDKQILWLTQMYMAGLKASAEGIDFQMLNVWALLGMYDWNKLLLQVGHYYEKGVVEVDSGEIILNLYSHFVQMLNGVPIADDDQETINTVIQKEKGWWDKSNQERILYHPK